MKILQVLNTIISQNPLMDYFITIFFLILGIIVILLVKRYAFKLLSKWAGTSESKIDDFLVPVIQKTIIPILYYGVFYLSLQYLILPPYAAKVINIIGIIILTLQAIRFLASILEYSIKGWLVKGDDPKDKTFRGIIPAVKVVLWSLGVIFLLDNLGFQIDTVLAGLGIGGIAVAMASQAILKDLFSYVSILFDKPFVIGDFIIIGEYLGEVEHIGIKTTRILSLSGEQLVFSNNDLTNSRIRNYMKMEKRRADFNFGIKYETDPALIKEIPSIIKNIVEKQELSTLDRAHFVKFSDYSLTFEVVYYISTPDYNKYMDIQQEINLAIMEEFHKRNIRFAYPTQNIIVGDGSETKLNNL